MLLINKEGMLQQIFPFDLEAMLKQNIHKIQAEKKGESILRVRLSLENPSGHNALPTGRLLPIHLLHNLPNKAA